jgi:hypothetical protein
VKRKVVGWLTFSGAIEQIYQQAGTKIGLNARGAKVDQKNKKQINKNVSVLF